MIRAFLEPYLVYIKLGALFAIVLAVIFACFRVQAWREAYHELPTVEAALELETLCGEGSMCLRRSQAARDRQIARNQEVQRDYDTEIAALRARTPRHSPVRLCADTGASDLRGSATAGAADGSAADAGLGDGRTQPDLGPGLYALAQHCDELTARARGLQSWAKAVSEAGP
jgi:hypothetical protein